MNLIDEIIYLDNSFIVEMYEKVFLKQAHTKYTKTTDVSLGFEFIAKTGASLKETFEYPLNTRQMYHQVQENLNYIDNIELNDSIINNLPDIFWMEGLFGIVWMSSNNDNAKKYAFSAASENGGKNLILATNDVYFSSGYDQLSNLASSFADSYVIRARMLIKFLGTTHNFSLGSPMVIKKIANHQLI